MHLGYHLSVTLKSREYLKVSLNDFLHTVNLGHNSMLILITCPILSNTISLPFIQSILLLIFSLHYTYSFLLLPADSTAYHSCHSTHICSIHQLTFATFSLFSYTIFSSDNHTISYLHTLLTNSTLHLFDIRDNFNQHLTHHRKFTAHLIWFFVSSLSSNQQTNTLYSFSSSVLTPAIHFCPHYSSPFIFSSHLSLVSHSHPSPFHSCSYVSSVNKTVVTFASFAF